MEKKIKVMGNALTLKLNKAIALLGTRGITIVNKSIFSFEEDELYYYIGVDDLIIVKK